MQIVKLLEFTSDQEENFCKEERYCSERRNEVVDANKEEKKRFTSYYSSVRYFTRGLWVRM